MCLLSADMRSETHHYGFSDDETSAQIKVFCHLLLVDDQAAEGELGLVERSRSENEALGNSNPLRMPRSRRAFEVVDRGIKHKASRLAYSPAFTKHEIL